MQPCTGDFAVAPLLFATSCIGKDVCLLAIAAPAVFLCAAPQGWAARSRPVLCVANYACELRVPFYPSRILCRKPFYRPHFESCRGAKRFLYTHALI